MKINDNTKKSNKKWLIILPLLVVILAGGAFAAYKFLNKDNTTNTEVRPVNSVDYNPPTEQEVENAAEVKKQIIEDPKEEQSTGNATILISRAGQSGPGLPIAVRTIITGSTPGTCDMTFTKGATSFSKTFEIKYEATTYTCNGDIESSNFNESGDWALTVNVGQTSVQWEGGVHVQK